MPSIIFSSELSTAFSALSESYFLTPSFLSELSMRIILPKQYESKQNILPILQETIRDNLLARNESIYKRVKPKDFKSNFDNDYQSIIHTHTLHVRSQHGIECIELKQKKPTPKYVIHFVGNGEDAMSVINFKNCIHKYPNHNVILWNYPGVGASEGHSRCVYDLYRYGLLQVQTLQAHGVAMKDICLSGRSLGGGIVSQVLRRLPQQGPLPSVAIERSFYAMSAVVVAWLQKLLESSPKNRPLLSAVLVFAMLGMSIGLIVSGIIATLSLLLATMIAAAGYLFAHLIMGFHIFLKQCLPDAMMHNLVWLEKVAAGVNGTLTYFALWVNYLGNGFGSMVGGFIAVIGLVSGLVFGAGIGGLLSLQLLCTDTPSLFFSLSPMIRFLARVAHAEMDSETALQEVLAYSKEPPFITVSNTENDEVILKEAALCTGLQFQSEVDPGVSPLPISEHIQFSWFKKGNHNYAMSELGRNNKQSANWL